MLLLYTLLLALLVGGHLLIRRRAVALEKKYARIAKEAEELLRNQREGVNRIDPYQNARRQYRLALLADRRDTVESRYTTWQDRSDRLGKLIGKLRAWKGRKLPYTLGALDVAGAFALVDYLGAGRYVNARGLLEAVSTLFTR
jgi:hypothetical protein